MMPSKQNQGIEVSKLGRSQDEWERWGGEGEDESRARNRTRFRDEGGTDARLLG